MKVGDLAEFYTDSQCWGIIVGIYQHQYEVYWMDGDRSWISKRSMVKRKEVVNESRRFGNTQIQQKDRCGIQGLSELLFRSMGRWE